MLNQLKGVFSSFEKHQVRYLVIGGIASVLYGVPRATFDLDILIKATPENGKRLLAALEEAKLGTAALISVDELLAHEITIFRDKIRIDVQTFTPGIEFEAAWSNRKIMVHQGQKFFVVSKPDLIASKRAAGRKIDLEDADLLELDDTE
jgi:hypothetical protein